jgi:hypothetical protein
MSAPPHPTAQQPEPSGASAAVETTPAQADQPKAIEQPTRPIRYWRRRARLGMVLNLLGFVIFLLGAQPGLFGMDRSPIIGFVQISVFLIGLAVICIGGYISLTSLWREQPTSIAADIGLRLVATGYVIAVFAGMADIFGFGSQPMPRLPYFGPWQARGVQVGQALIAFGFLLLLPYHQREKRKKKK